MVTKQNGVEYVVNELTEMLNSEVKVKPKKLTQEDIQKNMFYSIMLSLEKHDVELYNLYVDFKLNLSEYCEPLHSVIDTLLLMHYGKDKAEMIIFYLYSRFDDDHNLLPYVKNNKELFFTDLESLWLEIKK